MRNTIKVITLVSIAVLLFCATLCMSCVSVSTSIEELHAIPRSEAPVDAFVLVHVEQKLVPVGCATDDPDVDCPKILSTLPTLENTISGSGLLVQSDAGPSILTAEHVCIREAPTVLEHAGVKIAIENVVQIQVISPIRGKFNAYVIRTDKKLDLCLLKPSKVFTNPIKIAEVKPKLGDKVYAIAAPFGISDRGLALIFDGYYSGQNGGSTFYTIPTKPGSSGSAVLNEQYEVIGIIYAAFRRIEHIGIGTGLQDVRDFLFTPISVDVQKPSIQHGPIEIEPSF
jgi:S1-C subfamily serine protease